MLTLCTRVRLYAKKLFTYAPVTLSPDPTMAPPKRESCNDFVLKGKAEIKCHYPIKIVEIVNTVLSE